MVVGKLPFTTPYTDQYRKQKLQRQIEKGLSERHEKDMAHLSSGMSGIYSYSFYIFELYIILTECNLNKMNFQLSVSFLHL